MLLYVIWKLLSSVVNELFLCRICDLRVTLVIKFQIFVGKLHKVSNFCRKIVVICQKTVSEASLHIHMSVHIHMLVSNNTCFCVMLSGSFCYLVS